MKKATKMEKERINKILDVLEELYPNAECALNHGSVFQLLIAVTMSAQTTDKSVNVVTKELFHRYPDAKAMSEATEEELQTLIKRIGMYKTKSANILRIAKIISENYEGQVPKEYEELIKLPGVGRKTANVVLSVGFGQQRIAVDTHVFRVSNRIGLAEGKDVLRTELALMERLPEDRWSRAHHSLIFHGRGCCHARNPKCAICGIKEYCKWIK